MSQTTPSTLVVAYGDDVAEADQTAVVELDGTLNLDSDGETKTQFAPGDEVYFLVHHDADLVIDKVVPTDGTVVAMGAVSRSREADLLFVDEDAVSLSYLPAGSLSVDWQGREGSGLSRDEQSVTITDGWPALAHVAYGVDFYLYKLIPPTLELGEDESYTVHAVIYMEAAA